MDPLSSRLIELNLSQLPHVSCLWLRPTETRQRSFQATRLRYNLALDEGVLEDVYGVIDLDDTSDADELPSL